MIPAGISPAADGPLFVTTRERRKKKVKGANLLAHCVLFSSSVYPHLASWTFQLVSRPSLSRSSRPEVLLKKPSEKKIPGRGPGHIFFCECARFLYARPFDFHVWRYF